MNLKEVSQKSNKSSFAAILLRDNVHPPIYWKSKQFVFVVAPLKFWILVKQTKPVKNHFISKRGIRKSK